MASPRTYLYGERPTLRIIPGPLKLLKSAFAASAREDVDRVLRREKSANLPAGSTEKVQSLKISSARREFSANARQ
jgi:hypothetical protein